MSKIHERMSSDIRGLRKLLDTLSRAQTSEQVFAYCLNSIHDIFEPDNAFVLLHLVIGALGVYAFSRVVGARPLAAWTIGLLALCAGSWLHWSLSRAVLLIRCCGYWATSRIDMFSVFWIPPGYTRSCRNLQP